MFIGCESPSLTGNWFDTLIAIDVYAVADLICQRDGFTDHALQIGRIERGVQYGGQLIAQLRRPSVEIACTVLYVRPVGEHILRCIWRCERQICMCEGALDVPHIFSVE